MGHHYRVHDYSSDQYYWCSDNDCPCRNNDFFINGYDYSNHGSAVGSTSDLRDNDN